MDWASDNDNLSSSGSDLRRVFKYQPRPSRVVKIVQRNNYEAQIWSLRSPEDWAKWLSQNIDYTDKGIVLILADRSGHDSTIRTPYEPMSIEEWLTVASNLPPHPSELRRAATVAPLGEKSSLHRLDCEPVLVATHQPRSLRNLPFSLDTFGKICQKFHVHRSIVRAITRSDVPSICCERLNMKGPALVSNCRTPNSWDSDMALSATHFLEDDLTFGILYGCTSTIEKAVLKRLQSITFEAAHPMILPGILVEIELSRHTRLVETSVNEVETKIFELNYQSGNVQQYSRTELEKRNIAKRTAWLDLSYLRNSITTWSTQLFQIVEHTEVLNREIYNISKYAEPFTVDNMRSIPGYASTEMQRSRSSISLGDEKRHRLYESKCKKQLEDIQHRLYETEKLSKRREYFKTASMDEDYVTENCRGPPLIAEHMQRVGEKIRARIIAIQREYDEKIQDCTMRVDGMAMATQWAHSETAVEIALATNQDSRVMRSISLVTMVFLPGTFFATVFSMTFFDWFDDSGRTRVSSYLWIYVVVTVFFTAVTIGLWYFFVMSHRGSGRLKVDEEKLRVE